MRKGISGVAVLTIVAAFVMLLTMGIISGTASGSIDFTRQQSVNLQAERITNAMLVMETVPEGHMEMEMRGYQIKYDDAQNNLSLNFSGQIGYNEVQPYMISYDNIIAPTNYEDINSSLCIQKEYQSGQSTLILNTTGCGS